MDAPFEMFGQTLNVPVRTWTDGQEDKPAKGHWGTTIWVERPEDLYALLNPDLRGRTVRVVRREDWLRARDTGG